MIEAAIALWCILGIAAHLFVMEKIYRQYAEWVPRDIEWWGLTLLLALPSAVGGPIMWLGAWFFLSTRDWKRTKP